MNIIIDRYDGPNATRACLANDRDGKDWIFRSTSFAPVTACLRYAAAHGITVIAIIWR